MKKKTVLVADSEASSIKLMRVLLKRNDYEVLCASTGKEACSMAASYLPDLIITDMSLPDMDGTQIIGSIRSWSCVPIIVVSARCRESQKVAALDAGADDYVTKPFGNEELSARIRAALRFKRSDSTPTTENDGVFSCGELTVNIKNKTVYSGTKNVCLTRMEFKILELLCTNFGKVLTYDYMLKHIWGPYAKNDNKILRVNITNIRKKLEPDPKAPRYIITERGVGYSIAEKSSS